MFKYFFILLTLSLMINAQSEGRQTIKFPQECGEFFLLEPTEFDYLLLGLEELSQPPIHPQISCEHSLYDQNAWIGDEHYGKILVIPGKQHQINKRPHHLRLYYRFWKKQPGEALHLVPDYRTRDATVYLNSNLIDQTKNKSDIITRNQRKELKQYMYTILRDNVLPRVELLLDSEKKRFDNKRLFENIPPEFLAIGLEQKIDQTFKQIKENILSFKLENPEEQLLFFLSSFPSILQNIKDFPADPMRPLLCLLENQKHRIKIIKRYKKAASFIISAAALGTFIAVSMGAAIPAVAITVGVLTVLSGGSDFFINLKERKVISQRNKIAGQMFSLEKDLEKNLKVVLKAYKNREKDPLFKDEQVNIKIIINYIEKTLKEKNKILMSPMRYNNLAHDRYTNKKNIINLIFGGAKILTGGIYIGAALPALVEIPHSAAAFFHGADTGGVLFESEMLSIIAQSIKNELDKEKTFDNNEELIKKDSQMVLSKSV